MAGLDEVPTPALLLDLDRLERNLRTMAERAAALGVRLRPHAKTHKCGAVARRQVELGARGLTVATLEEAHAFAAAGFEDLTWALPVPFSRIEEARHLAERVDLGLLVDSMEAVDRLEPAGFPFLVWLKIDCGYHRAGVDPALPSSEALARRLSDHPVLRFQGLLTHSGQAYAVPSPDQLAVVAEVERAIMADTAGRWRGAGIAIPAVSVGSTPAMSAARSLEGIDEARPGNYVFYDRMQVRLGSCSPADCAVSVLASVVSSPPGAGHAVVDAGALALSKDPGHPIDRGRGSLGDLWADHAAGTLDPDLRLVALSQEHGVLSGRRPVGDRVRILPHHSCLAVACFDRYHVVRGDEVVAVWPIDRAR
jgi:D-serine deaminase-like pyridoxal phosphate-dependent protein